MRARAVVGSLLLSIAGSLLVALVVESLRAKGKLPDPSRPVLPTPVAPGQNTV